MDIKFDYGSKWRDEVGVFFYDDMWKLPVACLFNNTFDSDIKQETQGTTKSDCTFFNSDNTDVKDEIAKFIATTGLYGFLINTKYTDIPREKIIKLFQNYDSLDEITKNFIKKFITVKDKNGSKINENNYLANALSKNISFNFDFSKFLNNLFKQIGYNVNLTQKTFDDILDKVDLEKEWEEKSLSDLSSYREKYLEKIKKIIFKKEEIEVKVEKIKVKEEPIKIEEVKIKKKK